MVAPARAEMDGKGPRRPRVGAWGPAGNLQRGNFSGWEEITPRAVYFPPFQTGALVIPASQVGK